MTNVRGTGKGDARQFAAEVGGVALAVFGVGLEWYDWKSYPSRSC
jgi:hypothetical protein